MLPLEYWWLCGQFRSVPQAIGAWLHASIIPMTPDDHTRRQVVKSLLDASGVDAVFNDQRVVKFNVACPWRTYVLCLASLLADSLEFFLL